MKIHVITLFPNFFEPIINGSILGRGQKKGFIEFNLVDLRPFGEGVHQVVDGRPYGGGVGMILKANILSKALDSLAMGKNSKVILTSASGYTYTQKKARQLTELDEIAIICGHYEGVDQRFIDKYVDEEISIGDYVLTGGEIPAMVILDSVTRLIKGVLDKEEATILESFTENLLEHPHYTRPAEFQGEKVPTVLLSGNHQKIDEWRAEESRQKTAKVRPDLLKN